MNREDNLTRENQALRERLSRMSEAGLRINESLDFDTVLQEVLDSARALTQANYGVITLLDESGRVQDYLSSGLTSEEAEGVWGHGSEGLKIFNHFNSFQEPLRLPDLLGHIRSMGLPNFSPPMSVTADQRRGLIKTYLNPVLGDVEIDRITSEHVTEALRPIWNEKASTAKKVWLALTATFNYAIGQGWIPEGVDPLQRAKIGLGRQAAKVEHRKAVPYDRIGEVWRVLTATTAGKTGNTSRALQFIVLTGVRSSEATGARWAEFNMADATWTIPASRMKGGREHRVPLAPAALDVLRRAKEVATPPFPAYELTFPNGNGDGRQVNAMTALRFFHRQFEGDYSIHGLRSTFQDWAAEQTDTPAEIVEHALAHLEGSATIRAYRRTDYFEKRRSLMSAWADYVTAL